MVPLKKFLDVAEANRVNNFTLADAEYIVQRCDGCQRYARQAHVPAQELRTIPIDRKSTRLNSSHSGESRMPSSA